MSTVALFIGNLPINVSRAQLQDLLGVFRPASISLVSGRNFAYVELPEDLIEDAIARTNGYLLGNRSLVVKRADYMEPRTANEGATQRN